MTINECSYAYVFAVLRKWLIAAVITSVPLVGYGAEGFSLKAKFSIDCGTNIETLTFISGALYAFEYSRHILEASDRANFFCPKNGEFLASKIIVEKMNDQLSGDVTAELATLTITDILAATYPCPSPK